jgi:hypothetical protein
MYLYTEPPVAAKSAAPIPPERLCHSLAIDTWVIDPFAYYYYLGQFVGRTRRKHGPRVECRKSQPSTLPTGNCVTVPYFFGSQVPVSPAHKSGENIRR